MRGPYLFKKVSAPCSCLGLYVNYESDLADGEVNFVRSIITQATVADTFLLGRMCVITPLI
jgi:hypothetical protein